VFFPSFVLRERGCRKATGVSVDYQIPRSSAPEKFISLNIERFSEGKDSLPAL